MRHDMLLIEAALATDRTVVSLDDEVRGLFKLNIDRLRSLGRILWVNPDQGEEDAITWLQSGARPERHRMLGYSGEEG